MNSFSKLFALAFLVAGTALVTSAAPSGAQASRIAVPSGVVMPYPNTPVCCTPAQRAVVTNSSWAVKTPNGATQAAVPLSSRPYYQTLLPGSQWIGHAAGDGTYSNPAPPGGTYIYTYHFCLCGLPPKIPNQPFPAAMSLSILSDNGWTAYLNRNNGHPSAIGSFASLNSQLSFTTVHSVTAPSGNFVAGDNVLEIDVYNEPSTPTGLDVAGTISGFFQQTPCGPRDPTLNPN